MTKKTPKGWVLLKEGERIPKKYLVFQFGTGPWIDGSGCGGQIYRDITFYPMARRGKRSKR